MLRRYIAAILLVFIILAVVPVHIALAVHTHAKGDGFIKIDVCSKVFKRNVRTVSAIVRDSFETSSFLPQESPMEDSDVFQPLDVERGLYKPPRASA